VIWAGGTINKFFLGFQTGAGGKIESSPDGTTWTNVAGATVPNTSSRNVVAFSPALNRIIWGAAGFGNPISSDDGVTWTARTHPADFDKLFWSDYQQKFYGIAVVSATPRIYSSSDGITWSAGNPLTGVTAYTYATKLFEQGSLMGIVIGTDLMVSRDEFVTFKRVAEVMDATFAVCSPNGQLLLGRQSDGLHLATMRFGF